MTVYALQKSDGTLLLLNATSVALTPVPSGIVVAANETIQPIVAMPKRISQGLSGLVSFGFNIHQFAWGWVGPLFAQTGAKSMRVNQGTQVLAIVDAAVAQGLNVSVNIGITYLNLAQQYATAFAKHGDKVVIEAGNEPNVQLPNAAVNYYNQLKAFTAAARTGNPKVKVAAPIILASYTQPTKDFIYNWLNQPGVLDWFEVGNFHPYYRTPEWSWQNDISAFIKVMDAAATKAGKGKVLEYTLSECGYSNAIGLLADPAAENTGPTGETQVQNVEVAADYYSRYIPIARASAKVRSVMFYALLDEGAADPAMKNKEAHFGVYVNATTPKPAQLVCKDLFPHVHAATDAWMYTRGLDWYVKLKLPSSYVLIAWTTDAQHGTDLLLAGPAIWNLAGNATKTQLATGKVSIPLGKRSIVITSSVDFPEFA
jgi:hypothetical protein